MSPHTCSSSSIPFKPTSPYTPHVPTSSSPPHLGRASLHGKSSLRIENLRSDDQGWYECKVLMLEQQYDTFHNGSWVHLTVNGKYNCIACLILFTISIRLFIHSGHLDIDTVQTSWVSKVESKMSKETLTQFVMSD